MDKSLCKKIPINTAKALKVSPIDIEVIAAYVNPLLFWLFR